MPELGLEPYVHPGCEITESTFGRYCEIGQGARVQHTVMGDYSYCDRYCDIANADVGKFANIASFVRLGASDHPLDRASLHHFMYRSAYYWPEEADDAAWFEARRARRVVIGHDTWIGHNAQVKPEVTVGHGAVVAAGVAATCMATCMAAVSAGDVGAALVVASAMVAAAATGDRADGVGGGGGIGSGGGGGRGP